MMLTTDLALRFDPVYEPISRRFLEHPEELSVAFAKAWFKLTHRDMGPKSRYVGSLVPAEDMLWQDPVPAVDHELIGDAEIAALKDKVLASESHRGPTGVHSVGIGGHVPWHRQARWSQWCPHSSCPPARLGGQQSRRAGPGAWDP